MKKKNLIILLLIPFIIALLGIMTVNISFSTFYSDIIAIDWAYKDVEVFNINVKKYQLNAKGIADSNAVLDNGNQLVWKVENKDPSVIDPLAEILVENSFSYLNLLGEGEIIVTCSNLKGNIIRRMEGIIYSDGVITLLPTISGSQTNIDQNIYYGQYDLENTSKHLASFDLKYNCQPNDLLDKLEITTSDNITVDLDDEIVRVTVKEQVKNEDAYITLTSGAISRTYPFKIVKDGVNVYTYDDLLNCTNRSAEGEIVVLRKSFESLSNYNKNFSNNTTLFGKENNNKFDFSKDIYQTETTFNSQFINQWNNFAKANANKYKEVSKMINIGLRVQKDFYGNGYTINMHNLTYPSQTIGEDAVPQLGPKDLFRGPLPFYTLGNPAKEGALITAYGQDNVGMYLDGNNITLNDVNLKNCDIGKSIQFLETVGTVLEVHGDNNKVINSRISNGKNVIRSFSSKNLLIDNSLISNAMNFLITTGSNEYVPIDENKEYSFRNLNGEVVNSSLKNYLQDGLVGDSIITSYALGNYNNIDAMRNSLADIQNALTDNTNTSLEFKGNMVINDTYFYRSGLAAIALESLFNGPFLYSGSPLAIATLLMNARPEGEPLVPYLATNFSGLSYPVKVDLTGKTRFYDYKVTDDVDLTGLIDENLSSFISSDKPDVHLTIDDIFPLKSMLVAGAKEKGCILYKESQNYLNIPYAYYGGSLNLSKVNSAQLEDDYIIENVEINFTENYLLLQSNANDLTQVFSDAMLKAVTVVTGFEPFDFACIKGDYLYGEMPNATDLINNWKTNNWKGE